MPLGRRATSSAAISAGGLPAALIKAIIFDNVIREVLVSTAAAPGPIPVFPTLPYGFPVKVKPTMKTTVGATKSLREIRTSQQVAALWEIELLFEELRSAGQGSSAYAPLASYTDYEQLVQLWLSMYGQTNVFAFDAPWDDSRSNQAIGTGDGSTYIFTISRTWGQGTATLNEPIGLINTVFNVSVNNITISPSNYYTSRNKIYFIDAAGLTHPPGAGLAITMTFSFYYLCRFMSDDQDFEEFFKNRWTVKSLKFRSIYWP